MTPLGKILNSESHLLYHVRVYDATECAEPPEPSDYAFGRFVLLDNPSPEGTNNPVVGVVANSRLLNPEAGQYGPRLTIPHSDNAVFAPDYLNEVGVLVSILLLGRLTPKGGDHSIPTQVMPVGAEVRTMGNEELQRFHQTPDQRFQMRYYPIVLESRLPFASGLLQQICAQLEPHCKPEELRMLRVLQKNLAWQSTVGQMRN